MLGLVPTSAHAEPPLLQVIGSFGSGYTDNAASTPDAKTPGTSGPAGESFAELRPGLVLSYASDRTLQRLAYQFFGTLYYSHSENNSYSNRLDWQTLDQISKRSLLTTSLAVTSGRSSTFNLLTAPAQSMVGALPAGGLSFVSVDAQESFSYEVSPLWRAIQSLALSDYLPIDNNALQPSAFSADLRGGADRSWRRDALAVQARAGWTRFGSVNSPLMNTPQIDQASFGGLVRWRRDLSPLWSGEIEAGFLTVGDANAFSSGKTEPTALVALRYLRDFGQGELRYQHDAVTNVWIGSSFFVDEGSLRLSIPLAKRLGVQAGAGYQHGRAVAVASSMEVNTIDVWLGDGSLTWIAPSEELQISLRYQRFQQATDVMATPTSNVSRNVALATVGVVWPRRNPAAPVPRVSSRVDQADLPIGGANSRP